MSSMSRRRFLAAAAVSVAVPQAPRAGVAPVFLELFTSQGCSSCPPADQLFGALAGRADVYAVSLHVDYWDYLGWKDTLASPAFSRRQFDYGKTRGDMQVYTPQLVANGRRHAVGSNAGAVDALITAARADQLDVAVNLDVTAKSISVSLPAHDFDGEATLWLMAVQANVSQEIARGENTGLTVAYHNVVRNMVPATMWTGQAFNGEWMRDAVMPAGCTSCIAVLQRDKTGPVLGLARV